jgi:hypothetical protein
MFHIGDSGDVGVVNIWSQWPMRKVGIHNPKRFPATVQHSILHYRESDDSARVKLYETLLCYFIE